MKTTRLSSLSPALLLLIIAPLACFASSSVGFRGYSLTELYAFEDASSTQHQQLYQTLFFKIERLNEHRLTLVAHLRYQGDSADDFAESGAFKLHNLYLRWANRRHFDFRLGRQFLAEGVGFGTYDALRLNFSPVPWGSATVWGGLAAPSDRTAELQKFDDARALGLALRGRIKDRVNLVGSLLREDRGGRQFRHRAGISGTAKLLSDLHAAALVYLNTSGPATLHRARLLLRYGPVKRLRLFGEFALGTPQLPVDSPFEFVEIEATELVRLGGAYNIYKEYWLGLKAQSFLSSEEPNTALGISLEGPWGSLGFRQRFGDYGDESGVFGAARYSVTGYAQVYAAADFSTYKFEDLDEENQTAAQAGLRLFPLQALWIDASIQGLKNDQFDQDIRGLLRVKWSFSN